MKVNQADDPELTKELLSLVKTHNAGEDFWDTLHDEVRNNVEEAIIELDNGKGIPHVEMKKKHASIIGHYEISRFREYEFTRLGCFQMYGVSNVGCLVIMGNFYPADLKL